MNNTWRQDPAWRVKKWCGWSISALHSGDSGLRYKDRRDLREVSLGCCWETFGLTARETWTWEFRPEARAGRKTNHTPRPQLATHSLIYHPTIYAVHLPKHPPKLTHPHTQIPIHLLLPKPPSTYLVSHPFIHQSSAHLPIHPCASTPPHHILVIHPSSPLVIRCVDRYANDFADYQVPLGCSQ